MVMEPTYSLSPALLNEIYGKKITVVTKLHSFEASCIPQLFLLTFDERRTLTFWETANLRATTGIWIRHLDEAQKADSLRRRAERKDSNARNLNYQATETRKRLRDVKGFLSKQTADTEDLIGRHQQLDNRRRELAQSLR